MGVTECPLCWIEAHAGNPNRRRSTLGRFVPTRCAACGNVGDVDPSWDMDWWVSDEEWQRIVPEKYQNKTICPWCFVKFAQQTGERYKVRYTDFLGVVHESASGVEKINSGVYPSIPPELGKCTLKLEGSTPFKSKVNEALSLLSENECDYVQKNIARISEVEKGSGISKDKHFRLGKKSWDPTSPRWLACTIVHDAKHGEDFDHYSTGYFIDHPEEMERRALLKQTKCLDDKSHFKHFTSYEKIKWIDKMMASKWWEVPYKERWW